jgi:hypothetical protein
MKNLLKLEELAQFLACLFGFILCRAPWWVYPLLIIGPDIGMVGYLANAKVGAFTYNLFHHKGVAFLFLGAGFPMMMLNFHGDQPLAPIVLGTGIILLGHSSMDRMLGYGLKFGDDFKHTHLGWIGKAAAGSEQ